MTTEDKLAIGVIGTLAVLAFSVFLAISGHAIEKGKQQCGYVEVSK